MKTSHQLQRAEAFTMQSATQLTLLQ